MMSTIEKRGDGTRVSWFQLYLHGLGVSVHDNAQAFGFSILITVTYGIVSGVSGKPSSLELTGFALSAVGALSLLNVLVAFLKKDEPDEVERSYVLLVATATDFLSVGAGLGAAFATANISHGTLHGAFHNWLPWVLTPFLAGLSYALVQGLQIAVARRGADVRG